MVSYHVHTAGDAWLLMRAFEDGGVVSGYPSLGAPYTVKVRPEDRQRADAIAFEGPVRMAEYRVTTSVIAD